jgi:hypothetical protein
MLGALALLGFGDQRREHVGEPARLLGAGREERQRAHADRSSSAAERCDSGSKARRLSIDVPKEIEPHRRVLAGRPEVDDAAAQREVANLADQVGAPEAERHEAFGELGRIELAAARELEAGVEIRGGQTTEERAGRRHQRAPLPPADPVERHDLLGAHLERGLRFE